MGTVFYGKKWKGAYVNGKKVCGIVKNRVLFFKSDNYTPPISKNYKRRIVIEDNLSGKIISSTFVEGFKSVIVNEIPAVQFSEVDFLVSNEKGLITGQYIEDSYMGTVDYIISSSIAKNNSGGNAAYIYSLNTDEESIFNYNNFPISDEKEIIVTEIVNSATYRNFYIEDENIRPFEIGDVISENTKIYFVIPDNIGLSAINTMNPGKYTSNPVSFENNNVQIYGQISGSTYKVIFKASKDYTIYSSNFTNVSSNLSKFVPDSGTSFSATVSSINTDSYLYEYILVDKTTLG